LEVHLYEIVFRLNIHTYVETLYVAGQISSPDLVKIVLLHESQNSDQIETVEEAILAATNRVHSMHNVMILLAVFGLEPLPQTFMIRRQLGFSAIAITGPAGIRV
jgi:hypothetical protein